MPTHGAEARMFERQEECKKTKMPGKIVREPIALPSQN